MGGIHRVFTQEEIDYIKENFYKKTFKEMAEHLGRSTSGIAGIANKLKLRTYTKNEQQRPK